MVDNTSNAAASDSNRPKKPETIDEDAQEDATVIGDGIAANAPEMMETDPDLIKTHSIASALSNDDNSTQSMNSKAWTADITGSVSKQMSTNSPRLQFVFDTNSSKFPPIPDTTTAHSSRNDNASAGSANTVTKSEFEKFQTKLTKDLAQNLKECHSMASSMTHDSSHQAFINELRAERDAAAKLKEQTDKDTRAGRAQADVPPEETLQMNSTMMTQMQAMLSGMLPPSHFQGPPPFDPRQQQHQSQPSQHIPYQQPHQQQPQQQQPQSSQHAQHQHQHQQQPSQQLLPAMSQENDPPQQYQFSPPDQRPKPHQFKHPGSGNYFSLNNQQHRPPPPPECPEFLPIGMVWDPYNHHLACQQGGLQQQQQQLQPPQHSTPQQGPAQYQQQQYPEEQIEFDYNQYTQDAQSQPFPVTQKTPPGGAGQTYLTPERKRGKPAASNLTKIQNGLKANENSTSESAGGV
jgi:hypothetical protein